jgi:succinate dehydrogenase/fumarate reductase flavoprotein subunit
MASGLTDSLALDADVLVIGGGLAGTWAAVAAARGGASVVLVDKGFCGTSGVTATAGPGHWWVPPDPTARRDAIRQRLQTGFGLAEERWMARILEMTWQTLPTLAVDYQFGVDEHGVTQHRNMRGPEYMRTMRRLVKRSGARILDQSPALELLVRDDGSVGGARGVRRQAGVDWSVRAGAVVIATGGCAFLSRLLGCHTNTGDGYLMGVEAGAELSGMEFSNYYTIAPANSTMTRSMSYQFGTYFDADGRELVLPNGPRRTRAMAAALLKGPVFVRLDRMPEEFRARMPQVQPNFMLPFVRQGIDPYADRFEVTLRGEGTVRGTGGLKIVDDDCQTSVPGLFAAGDAATRELVAGATSGGGAQNSAWALSSGNWAGQGAAALARRMRHATRDQRLTPMGGAGLRPTRSVHAVDTRAAIASVQAEMHPYDKNIFRSGLQLGQSLSILHGLWREVRDHLLGQGPGEVRARETAALVASARWCYTAALTRAESRGMHQRVDMPGSRPELAQRLSIGGLDQIWTRFGDNAAARELVA